MPDDKINPIVDRDFILEQARKGINVEETQEDQTQEEEETTEETQETVEETQEEENTEETQDENTEEEETQEDEGQEEPKLETKKQREAFIRMRKENEALSKEKARLDKTIEALAKRSGMSVADYLVALDENLLEEEAQAQNVPVDTLKKIKELEDKVNKTEQERKQTAFINRISKLQTNFNLKQNEVVSFIQKAVENGIDIENENLNLEIIYKGLFADDIVKKAEQDRLARIKKNRESAPRVDKTKGDVPNPNKEMDEYMRKRAEELVKNRIG